MRWCSLVCVLCGTIKEILWPLSANLLERRRLGVRCPIASHGKIAMCKGAALAASIAVGVIC